VPIEGMFHGAIPILRNVTLAKYMTASGKRGFLFDGSDPESIAEIVCSINNKINLLTDIIKDGREFAKHKLSKGGQRNIMERFLNIIRSPKSFIPERLEIKYLVAFCLGFIVGYKIVPNFAIAAIYLILIIVPLTKCIRKDIPGFLTWLPYPMYFEVLARRTAKGLPYLTLQYFLIFSFAYLVLSGAKGKKIICLQYLSCSLHRH
jgi:hypothetical protein